MLRRACLVVLVAALLLVRDASAECGAKRTTCSACHDGAQALLPHGPWHDDHAFADLCPVCHGGQGEETAQAAAHLGMGFPLGDADTRCAPCHGANTALFVSRYRVQTNDAGVAIAAGSNTDVASPAPSPDSRTRPHGDRARNVAMALVIVVFGAAAAFQIVRHERARVARGA
jgi:hypothetical protein